MTRINKLGMFAGASVAALGLALAAAPATAFDEVGWTWDAHVQTDVNLKWEFDPIDVNPANLAMIEDLQIFIGDVSADSTVKNVFNNQPGEGVDTGGDVLIEFSHALDLDPGEGGDIADAESRFWIGPNGTLLDSNGDPLSNTQLTTLKATLTDAAGDGSTTRGSGFILVEIDGEIVPIDSFDALTELPEVVSAATAVANNASVDAEYNGAGGGALLIHEGQFAFNVPNNVDISDEDLEKLAGAYGETSSLNSNLVIAGLASTATLLDLLDHSEIEANSEVRNIHNATVDSAATAVANNFSGDMISDDPGVLIGDITQFALANVAADSDVRGVHLNDYTNLGENLGRPIVDSVATAVGNNKSISVSVGDVFD